MNAQNGAKYIIHSSSNVLGCGGSDNRALLKASADKSLRPLRMKKMADGSYIIALDSDTKGKATLYLSLGTANGWSTYFLTDSTVTRARYSVESIDQYYVRLKNMSTGGYLGTDDNNVGSYAYSDKSGTDLKHRWVLADDPTFTVPVDTVSYPVLVDAYRQENEGWGVSLCWWANMCGKWTDKKIDEIVDWMVSPTGLNWNIFRYNIGGGDDPEWRNCTAHHMGNGKGLRAEMEGFQDERGGEFHWERDAAQRKIMLKIKEKRPDAIFEAFSNSCPWWMTVSGCVSGSADGGSDNLKKDYYEDFADYLVAVCKHYHDEYGIDFKTLEPFNESVTGFWYQSGVQEGCHFDTSSQIAFLKVLAPKLKASGLSTRISASDETDVSLAVNVERAMLKDKVADDVAQFNTHTYSASNRTRSQFGSLARAAGKECWMSETGSHGDGISGNLAMAQRLFDDVRYICPSAWIDWQYMEEANDQWCFIRGSFSGATYNKVKNYYVRQQITRFIPKGYRYVTSLNEQSLAAVNPDCDTLALVLINAASERYHRISLPLASVSGSIAAWRTSNSESLKRVNCVKSESDSVLLVQLPDNSITTLLIPISTEGTGNEDFAPGDTFMIIPQSNTLQAVSVEKSKLILANANADDPMQQWTLEDNGSGLYRMKNANGLYATFSNSYNLLAVNRTVASSQYFDIQPVDGIFSKIMYHNDAQKRGWDLEGGSISTGTYVGLYAYGTSADADTRQWKIVRIRDSRQADDVREVRMPSATLGTPAYNLSGQQVGKGFKGIYIQNGKKMFAR